VYRVCWWAVLRERCIQCDGGQNRVKVVYSVLVGRTEGKLYTLCWWAEQRERCILCVGGQT